MELKRLHNILEEIQKKSDQEGEFSLTFEENVFLQLLDQVSEKGMESLTLEEKKFLKNFRNPKILDKISKKRIKRHPEKEESLFSLVIWSIVPIFFVLIFALFLLPTIRGCNFSRNLPWNYDYFESDHFRVYYPKAKEKEIQKHIQEGESFLKRLSQYGKQKFGNLSLPTYKIPFFFFLNQKDFAKHASSELSQDLSNNGGYFSPLTGQIALVLSKSFDGTQKSIRHELSHYLLGRGGNKLSSGFPAWLSEGLAVYFENANFVENRQRIPLRIALFLFKEKQLLPLPEVLDFTSKDFSSEENRRLYSYSGALVYFLKERNPEQFWKYVGKTMKGKDKKYREFLKYFGPHKILLEDWEDFWREIQENFAKVQEKKK